MKKEKLAYYGRMLEEEFNALFVSQKLVIKEGLAPKLNKKALFINAICAERGEVSLQSLNALFANSKKLDSQGYFKADDIITFEDLAKIQKASLCGAAYADQPDALRLLSSDGTPMFFEVHRAKKNGALSIALVKFDPCLVDVTFISKEAQKAEKEKKEREMLEKLLKKYGN